MRFYCAFNWYPWFRLKPFFELLDSIYLFDNVDCWIGQWVFVTVIPIIDWALSFKFASLNDTPCGDDIVPLHHFLMSIFSFELCLYNFFRLQIYNFEILNVTQGSFAYFQDLKCLLVANLDAPCSIFYRKMMPSCFKLTNQRKLDTPSVYSTRKTWILTYKCEEVPELDYIIINQPIVKHTTFITMDDHMVSARNYQRKFMLSSFSGG